MPNYYSDHFSDVLGTLTVPITAIPDPRPATTPAISHATKRYKRASAVVPNAATTAEIIYFMELKSSDRLHSLTITKIAWTCTNFDSTLGLYRTAEDGGAVVDVDTFCEIGVVPMDDLQDALVEVDVLLTNATVVAADRGIPLWQLVNEAMGAATYAEDPRETWVVAITLGTEGSLTVGGEIILKAEYTAGGN